jgi:hypothetical protein
VSESAVLPLKARTGQVLEIDFFGANGRETVDGLLAGLEDTFKEVSVTAAAQSGPGSDGVSDVTGRIWVARQGVHVDRIASAWLIRRFIDPAAQFKFVVGEELRAPSPGAALGYVSKRSLHMRATAAASRFCSLALHARQSFVLARTGWSHTPAPNHCCLPAGPMKAFAVELK